MLYLKAFASPERIEAAVRALVTMLLIGGTLTLTVQRMLRVRDARSTTPG